MQYGRAVDGKLRSGSEMQLPVTPICNKKVLVHAREQ